MVSALRPLRVFALAVPLIGVLSVGAGPALASPPSDLGGTTPHQLREGEDSQLRFLAFFLTRGELSNIAPENELLQGQTIGRLFGPNSANTRDKVSTFVEQRLIPFLIFEPKILNKKARLRASFDLRWTWGDTNYGVGGNFGGAINAHQVNLQTTNLEIELDLPWRGWFMNVGLMRLFDNPRDLYRTFFSTLALTGERLAFWGADAVGVTVHGAALGNTWKFGAYDLYENKIGEDDGVYLFEALTDRWIGRTLHIGGSVRWLRDRSSGAGGVSILGQGPNSRLTDYNGVFRFVLPAPSYEADIAWVALHASYNPEFAAGRFGGSAFVAGNFGSVKAGMDANSRTHVADIAGVAANARLGYKYGRTRNDTITADVMFTSGDPNGIDDGRYSGVITGNTWGAPGAAFTSHGAYLLLPHINVVNRFYAAVFDFSNIGYGLTAATLNASYDIVRNTLTLKLGGAVGLSNVIPAGGGRFVGVEANAMLVWRVWAFLTVEAHAAYLKLGDFFDSPRVVASGMRPVDPWTSFLALKWLMF